MEKQAPSGNDQHAAEVFFASYQRLASTIKKTSTMGHVQSDDAGWFSFDGLKAKVRILLLGIAGR